MHQQENYLGARVTKTAHVDYESESIVTACNICERDTQPPLNRALEALVTLRFTTANPDMLTKLDNVYNFIAAQLHALGACLARHACDPAPDPIAGQVAIDRHNALTKQ